jgi:hypothetical protein
MLNFEKEVLKDITIFCHMRKQLNMLIEWKLRIKNRAFAPSILTGALEDSVKKIKVDNV